MPMGKGTYGSKKGRPSGGLKGKQKNSLPLYDLIFATLGLAIGIYISYRYPVVSAEFY